MNRSILIVIADFLLVSLLAFSSFDASDADKASAATQLQSPEESLSENKDLLGILQSALEDERRARQQLAGELTQTKEAVRGQQDTVAEREKQNRAMQQALQDKEQQARQLEQQRAALQQQYAAAQTNLQALRVKEQQARQLEQQRNVLQQQFAAAQTNLQTLQQQLKTTATGALISQEKLAATEAELRKEQEQAAAAQQRLAQEEKARKAVETEKQQLAQQLQVVEAEKRLTGQQVASLQGEVQAVRTEKAQILQHADKLAEGVTTLAQSSEKLADRVSTLAKNSGDLTKEVRDYRPLAANSIFNEFASNRVRAQFQAFRSGTFGLDQNRRRETETILATDGGQTYSICHVEDTPLTFWNPGTDWEKLTGTLSRQGAQIPIERLSFYLLDPRIVLIPVSAEQAKQMNCKVYPIAAEPFKFQDAVLVGAREGYYGECRFQIDLTTPQYVKMDHSFFRGLFGKFNPSRGDLVFTKTGELLGVMANGTYCIVIHNFVPAATFVFGDAVLAQKTGSELSLLYRQISQLPQKLW